MFLQVIQKCPCMAGEVIHLVQVRFNLGCQLCAKFLIRGINSAKRKVCSANSPSLSVKLFKSTQSPSPLLRLKSRRTFLTSRKVRVLFFRMERACFNLALGSNPFGPGLLRERICKDLSCCNSPRDFSDLLSS